MADETKTPKGCPHDCTQCSLVQHAYCAAQMALNSFPNFDAIISRLDKIDADITELKAGKDDLATPEPKKAKKQVSNEKEE